MSGAKPASSTQAILTKSSCSGSNTVNVPRKMAGLHHEAGTGKLTGLYRKYNTSKFSYASRTEPAGFLLL
ncbi:unnamed protein product [Brassica rapa subsp. narinosa]